MYQCRQGADKRKSAGLTRDLPEQPLYLWDRTPILSHRSSKRRPASARHGTPHCPTTCPKPAASWSAVARHRFGCLDIWLGAATEKHPNIQSGVEPPHSKRFALGEENDRRAECSCERPCASLPRMPFATTAKTPASAGLAEKAGVTRKTEAYWRWSCRR